MTAFTLARDDAILQGVDTGTGPRTVVFQHGLGGSAAQVLDTMPERPAFRRLTMECRAQGGSKPGSRRPFSIAMFADDVLAAATSRRVDRFVAAGISMGAALALRLAARHPEHVSALILARPAWFDGSAPDNMRPYAEVAHLLRGHPPAEAKAAFAAGATAQRFAREAPDNLSSLLGFFDRPDPAVTADLLGDIARDGAGVDESGMAALRLPTLVIGHEVDLVHPLAIAQRFAAVIPGARLAIIPPKATDRAGHRAAFAAAVAEFIAGLAPATALQRNDP